MQSYAPFDQIRRGDLDPDDRNELLGRVGTYLGDHDGYPEEAVIFAQTACELRVEAAFAELLARRVGGPLGESIERLVSDPTSGRSKTKAVWTALTGDEI